MSKPVHPLTFRRGETYIWSLWILAELISLVLRREGPTLKKVHPLISCRNHFVSPDRTTTINISHHVQVDFKNQIFKSKQAGKNPKYSSQTSDLEHVYRPIENSYTDKQSDIIIILTIQNRKQSIENKRLMSISIMGLPILTQISGRVLIHAANGGCSGFTITVRFLTYSCSWLLRTNSFITMKVSALVHFMSI